MGSYTYDFTNSNGRKVFVGPNGRYLYAIETNRNRILWQVSILLFEHIEIKKFYVQGVNNMLLDFFTNKSFLNYRLILIIQVIAHTFIIHLVRKNVQWHVTVAGNSGMAVHGKQIAISMSYVVSLFEYFYHCVSIFLLFLFHSNF